MKLSSIRGLTYILRNRLYLSLTNQTVSKSPIELRGPAFVMPSSSGFEPLQKEPTAEDIFHAVEKAFEDNLIAVSDMDSEEVTFAGIGEPLLRYEELVKAVELVKDKRHGVPFRVKTSGLIDPGESTKVGT